MIREANLEKPISIPFAKKKEARELGFVFLTKETNRGWYFPLGCSEEEKEKLESFQQSIQSFTHTVYEKIPTISKTENNSIPEIVLLAETPLEPAKEEPKPKVLSVPKSAPTKAPSEPQMDLRKALEEEDGLYLTWALQKKSLPKSAEVRTKLLTVLGKRGEGIYPISYMGLLSSSPSFAEEYPLERVMTLLRAVITGALPYEEEIRESNLTEEEKALLLFALPLEGE